MKERAEAGEPPLREAFPNSAYALSPVVKVNGPNVPFGVR